MTRIMDGIQNRSIATVTKRWLIYNSWYWQ